MRQAGDYVSGWAAWGTAGREAACRYASSILRRRMGDGLEGVVAVQQVSATAFNLRRENP